MKALLLIGLVFTSQTVLAHADHKPPPKVATCAALCGEAEITAAAPKALEALMQTDPKREGWGSGKFVSAKSQEFDKVVKGKTIKKKDWVLRFTDETKRKGEQTLYVFVTEDGLLNGSNFTGK